MQRSENNDSGSRYGGAVTDKGNRAMAAGTKQTGSSYDANDLTEHTNTSDSGSRAFFAF